MTLKRTVAKVTLDQLFYAPSQQTVILVTIGALQGFSLQQIGDKVQRELPTITFTGWKDNDSFLKGIFFSVFFCNKL